MPLHTLYPHTLKSRIFVLFSHIYCFSGPPSAIEYITYQLCLVNSSFVTILLDKDNKTLEIITIRSYIEFRRVYRSFSLYNASFSMITIDDRLYSNIIPFNKCNTGRIMHIIVSQLFESTDNYKQIYRQLVLHHAHFDILYVDIDFGQTLLTQHPRNSSICKAFCIN